MYHPRLSHLSIVSAIGAGTAATLASLRAGTSGLLPCAFETVDLSTWTGTIDALDDFRLPKAFAAFDCRNNRLAEMALRQDGFEQAVAASVSRHGARRVGLFLGTSTSGILQGELAYRQRDTATGTLPASFDYERTHCVGSLSTYLAQRLGIAGPSFVISCACASSAKAFGSAQRMIQAGLCDAAIVGGADSLCLTTLYGFHALGLNAPGPCRPFDVARDGISIGEAGGFALLEKARVRPDGDDVMLLGVGESNDAYHMSSPHRSSPGQSTTSTCMVPRRKWAMPPRTSRYPLYSATAFPAAPRKAKPVTPWEPLESSKRLSRCWPSATGCCRAARTLRGSIHCSTADISS
jgi:3-oxoacyl-[acyl-carrier-protein] synthase-1